MVPPCSCSSGRRWGVLFATRVLRQGRLTQQGPPARLRKPPFLPLSLSQRNGVEVVVLEARERVGGRVHSFKGPFGAPVDLGASLITGACLCVCVGGHVHVLQHCVMCTENELQPRMGDQRQACRGSTSAPASSLVRVCL